MPSPTEANIFLCEYLGINHVILTLSSRGLSEIPFWSARACPQNRITQWDFHHFYTLEEPMMILELERKRNRRNEDTYW